eukprot:10058506-Alexandrium_andersonii.AAC.1
MRPPPVAFVAGPEGNIETEHGQLDACMRAAWTEVYNGAGDPVGSAAGFLKEYAQYLPSLETHELRPLEVAQVVAGFRRAAPTAPGTDG